MEINTLESISLTHTDQETRAHIQAESGEMGEMVMAPEMQLSGETGLGLFTIEVREALRIERTE